MFTSAIRSEALVEYMPSCLLPTHLNIQYAYIDFLKAFQSYHLLTHSHSRAI